MSGLTIALISLIAIANKTFQLSDDFATVIPSGADLNNYKTAGTYITTGSAVTNSLSNCPASNAAIKLVVIHDGYSSVAYGGRQILFENDYIFVRRWSGSVANGSWQSWEKFELVNASGTYYIRYESGLQICWGGASHTSGTHTFVFPLAFANNNIAVMLTPVTSDNFNSYSVKAVSVTSTGFKSNVSNTNNTAIQITVNYVAVGYWK